MRERERGRSTGCTLFMIRFDYCFRRCKKKRPGCDERNRADERLVQTMCRTSLPSDKRYLHQQPPLPNFFQANVQDLFYNFRSWLRPSVSRPALFFISTNLLNRFFPQCLSSPTTWWWCSIAPSRGINPTVAQMKRNN